jgi:two-component system, NtrC family, sensor kinase
VTRPRDGDLVAGLRRALDDAERRLEQEQAARQRAEAELRQVRTLETVGRLAAGVAHEINTPLQFAINSAEFLAESVSELLARAPDAGPDDAWLRENCASASEMLIEGLSRVAAIVRAMKDFTRTERATHEILDVNRIVESTLVVSAHEYRHVADVEVVLGAVPPVLGHPGELGQVLVNLIVNASHAIAGAPSGSRGRIAVRTAVDGDRVTISVSDTGGGIPEAIRDKVFDAFFTTKEVGRGTGQGLALSRAIVMDHHGGTLEFESTVGHGTTFVIKLPAAAAGTVTRAS